jgi:hypothetical protein
MASESSWSPQSDPLHESCLSRALRELRKAHAAYERQVLRVPKDSLQGMRAGL